MGSVSERCRLHGDSLRRIMLITSGRAKEGSRVIVEGDKIKGFHVENVTEIVRQAAEDRKDRNNGWTKERTMRHIARLPNHAYLEARKKYPEIDNFVDRAENKRVWHKIRKDPEFSCYFTVAGGV